MDISNATVSLLPLTLRESYTIAYQTVENVENVLLDLTLNGTIHARGVCAPEEAVTNETPLSTKAALEEKILPVLLSHSSIKSHEMLLDLLKEQFHDLPAARACIDFALYSAVAKSKKCSVTELLGNKNIRRTIPTTITVNIHPALETAERVKAWLVQGFTMAKIKGGLNIEEDIEKLFLLKQNLKTLPPLLFDANQGYSFDEAMHFIKETRALDLIAIEQPIDRKNTEDLCRLAGLNSTPIMADEAACSIDDIRMLAKGGVQYFNIKLMKCGGLLEGKRLIETALSMDKKIILSCMDECALSNAFSLSLALAYKEIQFVDLDSFTDYTVDPTRDCILLKDGQLGLNRTI